MPSPFTWDVAKPAGGDALNIGDNQIRTDKTTIRDVLRTLVPFGTPTVGWRVIQITNDQWITNNASYDGAAWNRDDIAVASRAIRYNADGTVDFLYVAAAANPIVWSSSQVKVGTGGELDVGTAIRIGSNVAATGAIRIQALQAIKWRNNANSADLTVFATNSSDLLELGISMVGASDATQDIGSVTRRIRDIYSGGKIEIADIGANLRGYFWHRTDGGVDFKYWKARLDGSHTWQILRVTDVGADVANTGWNINSSGTMYPSGDAAQDFGGGSNRIRDIYASGSVRIGTNPAAGGQVRLANATSLLSVRNVANSGDISVLQKPTGDELRLGDGGQTLRMSSGLAAPLSLANGDWWVEVVGTSPSRVAAIKVQDGGTTRTIASLTF